MVRYVVGGCLLVLQACGGSAPPPPSKNLLVLEVGGDHQPLSSALSALQPAPRERPAVPPSQPRSERSEPRSDPVPVKPPVERPAKPPVKPPAKPPVKPPEPALAVHTVRLGEGQSVAGLAREHLGDHTRWREILELNGWTEAEAMRLPVGAKVVMPVH